MNTIKDSKFFIGGNAIFTVSNGLKHYTFKVRQPKKDSPYFVNMLTGPQNTSDYTYMGIFNPTWNKVILTKKSKYTNESQPVNVFNWAMKVVKFDQKLPEGYSIQHEGKCCRCGRTLTTPESIANGIGPECAKKGWRQ